MSLSDKLEELQVGLEQNSAFPEGVKFEVSMERTRISIVGEGLSDAFLTNYADEIGQEDADTAKILEDILKDSIRKILGANDITNSTLRYNREDGVMSFNAFISFGEFKESREKQIANRARNLVEGKSFESIFKQIMSESLQKTFSETLTEKVMKEDVSGDYSLAELQKQVKEFVARRIQGAEPVFGENFIGISTGLMDLDTMDVDDITVAIDEIGEIINKNPNFEVDYENPNSEEGTPGQGMYGTETWGWFIKRK